MPTTVHDILERARATGQKLGSQEGALLFAAAMRLASAQGATLRARLVKIEDSGELKLLPFEDSEPETEMGYLAPELLAADAPRKSEPRVQVYAAGALGYELLTGKPPPDPTHGPGPELTGPLADMVRMALAVDRRERFGDLGQLCDAVEGAQPRLAAEAEKQLFAGIRTRASRWGGPAVEKEALAKLIAQLGQLEAQVAQTAKQVSRLDSGQRQALERLDRFEEGFRRTDELKRKKPSIVLPAMLSGVFAGGLVVAGIWGAGMLGAGSRPPFLALIDRGSPPPAEPPRAAEPPRPPEPAKVAEARAPPAAPPVPIADPGAREAPDAAVAIGAPDAGAEDAAASVAAAPDAGTPRVAQAPPQDPARKPSPKKAEAPITNEMMMHAVAVSQVKRGERALEAGKVDEALESFRAALENEPTIPGAYRGLGMAYAMHNDEKLALQSYQRYLQLAPNAPDARDIRKAMNELKARQKIGAAQED